MNNSKILLLWPKFFNYEKLIKKKYEELGYSVIYYDERPVDSSYGKAILRLFPSLVNKVSERYYKKINQKHKDNKFDYIIIGDSDAITIKSLKEIKELQDKATMILYLGDSVRNIKGILKKTIYFDEIYSFDKEDCERYNFKFLPYFFADIYSEAGKSKDSHGNDYLRL